MDGFEALKLLKANAEHKNIPVIFLTGKNDVETESRGFEMGAVDFISKPFSRPVLLNRIKTHLGIEDIIRERTASLKKLKNGIVSVLSNLVENRDRATGKHVERTTRYLRVLLTAMSDRGVYSDELAEWDIELSVSSARLHDIGKIVVSDLILNKTGKLTEKEFQIIKRHASEGEKIIDNIIVESGDGEYLHYAKLFAGYHHERWDGKGYPHGLSGTEIPLQGRIMAIADVYDALVSDRPYKKAFTHEEAVQIISENKGAQFDPKIVDIFIEVGDLFAEAALCR